MIAHRRCWASCWQSARVRRATRTRRRPVPARMRHAARDRRDVHDRIESARRDAAHQRLHAAGLCEIRSARAGALHARRRHRRGFPARRRARAGVGRQRDDAAVFAGRHREHRAPPRPDRPDRQRRRQDDRAARRRLGGVSQVHPRRADARRSSSVIARPTRPRSSANRWRASSSSKRFSSSPTCSTLHRDRSEPVVERSQARRRRRRIVVCAAAAREIAVISRAAASSTATSIRRRCSPISCAPTRRPACAGITKRCPKRNTRRSIIRPR